MRRTPLMILVAGVLVIVGLLALIAYMDGLSGSELIVQKSTLPDPAIALDEDEVRKEYPVLARLLDEAMRDGRATHRADEENLRIERYLDRLEEGADKPRQPLFEWRGQKFLINRAVY